jgi:hypothetical protein
MNIKYAVYVSIIIILLIMMSNHVSAMGYGQAKNFYDNQNKKYLCVENWGSEVQIWTRSNPNMCSSTDHQELAIDPKKLGKSANAVIQGIISCAFQYQKPYYVCALLSVDPLTGGPGGGALCAAVVTAGSQIACAIQGGKTVLKIYDIYH